MVDEDVLSVLATFDPGLWSAVAHGSASAVYMLLNCWCRVNIDRTGTTLLDFARTTGHGWEVCTMLEEYEVTGRHVSVLIQLTNFELETKTRFLCQI